MPSTTERPSASLKRTPSAPTTTTGSITAGMAAYGCHTLARSRATKSSVRRSVIVPAMVSVCSGRAGPDEGTESGARVRWPRRIYGGDHLLRERVLVMEAKRWQPPDDLPLVERIVVRLVVLDAAHHVLLFHTRDPTYP